jgi:hypothetical protein
MTNTDKYGARLGTKRAIMNALFDRQGGASREEIERAMMESYHRGRPDLAKLEFKRHSSWMRKQGWWVKELPNGNIRFQCIRDK